MYCVVAPTVDPPADPVDGWVGRAVGPDAWNKRRVERDKKNGGDSLSYRKKHVAFGSLFCNLPLCRRWKEEGKKKGRDLSMRTNLELVLLFQLVCSRNCERIFSVDWFFARIVVASSSMPSHGEEQQTPSR